MQASYICFTVEDTIQDDLGGLKMNIIGYEDVILSNHKNRFDMTAHPIIIANRHVVLKLWHLKNVGIKLANHILSEMAYNLTLTNFC